MENLSLTVWNDTSFTNIIRSTWTLSCLSGQLWQRSCFLVSHSSWKKGFPSSYMVFLVHTTETAALVVSLGGFWLRHLFRKPVWCFGHKLPSSLGHSGHWIFCTWSMCAIITGRWSRKESPPEFYLGTAIPCFCLHTSFGLQPSFTPCSCFLPLCS